LLELRDAPFERLQSGLVALAKFGELALHLLDLAGRCGGGARLQRPDEEAAPEGEGGRS
jgi:hypothetical protein